MDAASREDAAEEPVSAASVSPKSTTEHHEPSGTAEFIAAEAGPQQLDGPEEAKAGDGSGNERNLDHSSRLEDGRNGGSSGGRGVESDEGLEVEEEEEEEEEPRLKYQRLGSSVTEVLSQDAASCFCASDKLLALGTHDGTVHVLDYAGNEASPS